MRESAGSGFRSLQELAFANYQVLFTLCNRATRFSKPSDAQGAFQRLSFLLPLGAPEEGFVRPGPATPLRWRREEAPLEAQLQLPGQR